MKKTSLIITLFGVLFIWLSCGTEGAKEREKEAPFELAKVDQQPEVHGTEIKEVKLTNPLDQAMITSGKGIYDMKCSACHKLTDEKLVGPGWKDVTKRRQPVWIMNMITNVDMMLEKDPEAQKMLEQCLVRMPNQNISEKESRDLVEYMRKNDGEK
jgi:mono/diheme cytochrome c family protein